MRSARCCRWHRGGLGFRSSLFTLKSMAHRCQTALELEICPKNLRDLSIVKSAGRQIGRFQQPWACREGPRYSTLLLRTLMGELRHASGRGTRWRSVFSNLFPYWKKNPRVVAAYMVRYQALSRQDYSPFLSRGLATLVSRVSFCVECREAIFNMGLDHSKWRLKPQLIWG